LLVGNSELGDMYGFLSENWYILAVRKIIQVRTTTAKDKPYSRTTMEFLFDLYYEKRFL
jgi:hypothetical protein